MANVPLGEMANWETYWFLKKESCPRLKAFNDGNTVEPEGHQEALAWTASWVKDQVRKPLPAPNIVTVGTWSEALYPADPSSSGLGLLYPIALEPPIAQVATPWSFSYVSLLEVEAIDLNRRVKRELEDDFFQQKLQSWQLLLKTASLMWRKEPSQALGRPFARTRNCKPDLVRRYIYVEAQVASRSPYWLHYRLGQFDGVRLGRGGVRVLGGMGARPIVGPRFHP